MTPPSNKRLLSERFGESLVRTPTYEICDTIDISGDILSKRLKKVELTVTPQKSNALQRTASQMSVTPGVFPLLDPMRISSKSARKNRAKFVKGKNQMF